MPVYYTDDAQTMIYRTGNVDVSNAQVKWGASAGEVGLSGYRLPTEAEWERAARFGRFLNGQRFPTDEIVTQVYANYYGSLPGVFACDMGPSEYNALGSVGGISPATSPVGSFAPNYYGLNDMVGNVSEWCWDWYGPSYQGGVAPRGAATGVLRVHRGGSWDNLANVARCDHRSSSDPGNANSSIGFRTVLPLIQ
jgi:sulfatase modifying factor 1